MGGVEGAVFKREKQRPDECRYRRTCHGRAEFRLRFGESDGLYLQGENPPVFTQHVCSECLKGLLSRWTEDEAGHNSFVQVSKYGSPQLDTGAGV